MRRVITVLFIFFCWSSSAQSILEKSLDLSTEGRPIRSILNDITTDFSIDFYYENKVLEDKVCQENLQGKTLITALPSLLEPHNLGLLIFREDAIIIAPISELSEEWNRDFFVAKQQEIFPEKTNENVIIIGDFEKGKNTTKASLSGKIVDATTGDPIESSTIYDKTSETGVVTKMDGTFEMELKPGVHDIEIKSIGYENYEPKLQFWSADFWLIELIPTAYNISEVTVTEKATDQNIREVQVGVQRITPKQIKELPAFLGEPDVLKSLLTLPGVTTVGEGASGLNIRGGSVDQNLILQDGAPVFNASHVLGFFSAFNADAIRTVSLFKGNIPAQYGGRLSSILDIQIKTGDYDQLKARGGVGIVASKLTLETPIIKGKTSILASGRSSYSDYLLKIIDVDEVKQSSAYFYDGVAKVSHKFSNGSNISLSHYQSFDRFRLAQRFGYSWATRISTLQYNQLFSEQLSGNFLLATGALDNSFFQPTGFDAFELTNGIGYWKAEGGIFWNYNKQHKIHAGASWIRYNSKEERLRPFDEFSTRIPDETPRDKGQEWGIYINDEYEITDFLSVNVGLRYSMFQQLGNDEIITYQEGLPREENTALDTLFFGANEVIQSYDGWEPRLAAVYRLNGDNSLKISYNRINQYIHLISNTTVPTPVDIWQVSTTYLPPQRADNFSIGYFQNFANNRFESSVEAYYRNINSIVEYRDFANLLLEEHLETQLLTGKGKAYGLELFFKKNTGVLSGQISYTFSRSWRQATSDFPALSINDGDWFPSNYDQPHSLKATMNYKTGKKHKTSLNFVYNTGRPVTAPYTQYYLGTTIVPQYAARNSFRIPDYHRLDFSYTYSPNAVRKTRYKSSFTFTLYNVYGRRNAFSVFFERNALETTQAFKLSILGAAFPAISYNFEFE